MSATRQLKPNCLGFTELLAQNVALISPTMTAALIVPVMYSNTGDWSWLSYALGTVMLMFVAFNLNQFAKRSTSAGSMYAYICRGLGLTAGAIGGWALIWAYLGISIAGITGFTIFAGKLLSMMGLDVPPVALFVVCIAISWFCAWKNVNLSARTMLICEAVSMAFILLLSFIVLGHHGFAIDKAQFDTKTIPWSSIGLGVVVAIFSLVGFEAATAFGDEAKDPLKTVPQSIYVSLIISGIFFVFVTYVEVFGIRGYSTTLDKIDQPLNILAQLVNIPVLQIPLSAGAMLSFFALNLSCISAGGRVIYAMGRHGIFPEATAAAHEKNETPHIAISVMAFLSFCIPTAALLIAHCALLDAFNDAGTCAAFGFVVAYGLVSAAAPAYLRKLGQVTAKDWAGSAASLLLLAIPAVGSVYPVPAPPVSYFPYAFLVYLAIGIAWILAYYRRQPSASTTIQQDLEQSHARFQSMGMAE
ncbi:MAG TPA: APC family permease [Methylovirgula sp.]|nr:APC family permease [Methylovirgula sp.]